MAEYLFSYSIKKLRNSYVFIFLCHINFFNIIIYIQVNLEKSRLGAAASLGGGGQTAFRGGQLPPPLPRDPNGVPVQGICPLKLLTTSWKVILCTADCKGFVRIFGTSGQMTGSDCAPKHETLK